MGRLAVFALALLGACAYNPERVGGTGDDAVASDGPLVQEDGTGGDGAPCVPGFLDVCGQVPASGALALVNDQIDTDNDPRCRTFDQPTGPDVCLIVATSVTITGVVTALGSRPLAIVSESTFSITNELDVSSRRGGRVGPGADDATCSMSAFPETDPGGAGGAAGGSVGEIGGVGGIGDLDNSIGGDGNGDSGKPGTAMGTLQHLRAGCAGAEGGDQSAAGDQGGLGGRGGGGVYLAAKQSISIAGRIRATGAGGDGGGAQAGGGGGGAGGIVVLEAPTVTLDGEISANGAGGGEGGANVGGTPVTGVPGADGDYGTSAAAGGAGNDNRFGFGGAGGFGTTSAVNGTSSDAAGGGGGGSVGAIRILGTRSGAGTTTPPAI